MCCGFDLFMFVDERSLVCVRRGEKERQLMFSISVALFGIKGFHFCEVLTKKEFSLCIVVQSVYTMCNKSPKNVGGMCEGQRINSGEQ